MANTVEQYVIIKEGLYYKPNQMGYTGVLKYAGRYSEDEAKSHARIPGIFYQHEDTAPRFSANCFSDIRDREIMGDMDELEAENRRLRTRIELLELTQQQWTFLNAARNLGEVTTAELRKTYDKSSQAVSVALRAIMRKGYLEREERQQESGGYEYVYRPVQPAY